MEPTSGCVLLAGEDIDRDVARGAARARGARWG
ncbi:MAG: hypothetical protein MZW92_39625 [Comamonadaceae bacterium]|nr:hypothetical protein [Comamonadaceae bacterium]